MIGKCHSSLFLVLCIFSAAGTATAALRKTFWVAGEAAAEEHVHSITIFFSIFQFFAVTYTFINGSLYAVVSAEVAYTVA